MADFVKKNFGFSMKNIPIPGRNSYLKQFIFRMEDFITRVRWVALFFLKKEAEKEQGDDTFSEEDEDEDFERRTFGFRSSNVPPPIKEIAEFEKDLWDMVENIQFSNKKLSPFQRKMKKEIKNLNESDKLLIPADKTSNMYELKPETYNKLLKDNITRAYKKVDNEKVDEINNEAKNVAKKLKIADRIEKMPERDAFVTLKDHKQNFLNNTQCRLINPTKSEIGKISSILIKEINSKIRAKTGLKQWRSTGEAIDWFRNIEKKKEMEFIQCDIENLYPSITENLLSKSIEFAEKFTHIPEQTKKAILNARKTVLVSGQQKWQKKDSIFDVSMGAYDGAEVAELVGLKILSEINEEIPEINFGLYRDDGLAVTKTGKGCKFENIKKKLIKVFKNNGLKITIDTRLHEVNFLDITFHLQEATYKPYKKPGDKTMQKKLSRK